MPIFRISSPSTPKPESPAILFRDLKRDPSIKFLWDHQGKLLDQYFTHHLKTSDLALELPTGSGKTLVALLIAEYRRRANSERVAFLCPTRQLCSQVAGQARKYGVPTALLTGSQKKYDLAQFMAYQQAKSIAITTYSGVFNTNPRINDAELLICDDAHAAHNYVASPWTLEVNRFDHKDLFSALYRAIHKALPENLIYAIESYESNPYAASHVDLVSTIALQAHFGAMRQVLDEFTKDTDLAYSWSEISGHLDACAVYCSGDTIEIRPIVPPTETHRPFAGAKQRIYMSATLGEDGDIERSFGAKKIARLPVPEGWDKRGTGRRLVLFPGYGKDDKSAWETAISLLGQVNRSLILVPDDRTRKQVEKLLDGRFPVLAATDVEQSMAPFTSHAGKPVLIITNRWEGIDLPGEDCRLMALVGSPAGAGLQEHYLLNRLGAVTQLRDRIRTRVTQAMGRCTRDEGDYSIVLMMGNELLKWCCTQSNTNGMHPELQAEIAFGLENSSDRTMPEVLELSKHFLGQTEDWQAANENIVERRSSISKVKDAAAGALAKAAPAEIDFVYRLWNGEYDTAFTLANQVLAALEGGNDLKPYRSFWHHQAAVAAHLAHRATNDEKFKFAAIDALERASTTSVGIRWLGAIRAQLQAKPAATGPTIYPVREWFQEITALLTIWGISGGRFAKVLAGVQADLESDKDAKAFERGLAAQGKMLGARAHQWSDDGAPDGLWIFGDWHAFVFEAKTDQKPGTASLAVVRQAATHEARVRADKLIPDYTPCTTIIVSNHAAVDRLALPHVKEIRHVTQAGMVAMFRNAGLALEQVRTHAATLTDEALQAQAERMYREKGIGMAEVQAALERVFLRDLGSSK